MENTRNTSDPRTRAEADDPSTDADITKVCELAEHLYVGAQEGEQYGYDHRVCLAEAGWLLVEAASADPTDHTTIARRAVETARGER